MKYGVDLFQLTKLFELIFIKFKSTEHILLKWIFTTFFFSAYVDKLMEMSCT